MPKCLPASESSARKLSPRVFSGLVSKPLPRKPDMVVGWQDTAELAGLSEGDKKLIHARQKECSQKVTDFGPNGTDW